MANVLIGYSACPLTRQAFEAQGHNVWTCDLLDARDGSPNHFKQDVREVLTMYKWDFAVLHPMCTYLTVSAAWAYNDPDYEKYPGVGYHQKVKPGTLVGAARRAAQAEELENFRWLLNLPFPCAIENPARSYVCTAIRKPDQSIQPYDFGDDASKITGLWLSPGVPKLVPTCRVAGRIVEHNGKRVERWANQTDSGQNCLSPGANRWLERSATYPGIAAAMGAQWGAWLNNNAQEGYHMKRMRWHARAVKARPWDTVPLYFLIIAEYGEVFTEVRISPEQVKQNDWPFYETVIRTMNHLLRSHPA